MSNLKEAEKRIVELCERAEAELGWEFVPHNLSGKCQGCALEAAAVILGRWAGSWSEVGRELGLSDTTDFGAAFDCVAEDMNPTWLTSPDALLGAKLARRFVHKEGVSK